MSLISSEHRAAMLARTLIGHRSRLTWFALRSLFFLIVSLPVMYSTYKKMKKVAQMAFYGRGFLSRRFLNAYLMLNAISVWGVGRLNSLCFRGKCSAYQSMRESEWFHKYQWTQTHTCSQSQYIPDCWELASTDKHTQPKLLWKPVNTIRWNMARVILLIVLGMCVDVCVVSVRQYFSFCFPRWHCCVVQYSPFVWALQRDSKLDCTKTMIYMILQHYLEISWQRVR